MPYEPFKDAPNREAPPTSADDFVITCNDEPITILLVDDDEDCRSLIRDAVSECKVGNEIHECRNGREAPPCVSNKDSLKAVALSGLRHCAPIATVEQCDEDE